METGKSPSEKGETQSRHPFPPYKGLAPAAVWPAYFEKERPPVDAVRDLVSRLHGAKEYEHVISVIQSAILNGQAQPWMYEILAMEMEVMKRPKEEIERVALSISDFGRVDFSAMMYSGAYLAGFGRTDSALRMYRQASSMAPERPEPYLMALPMAKKSLRPADVEWVAAGILDHVWIRGYMESHRAAEDLAGEVIRKLVAEKKPEEADALGRAVKESRRRDVRVIARWVGSADVDLSVEEPGGGVCSFQQKISTGGGYMLREGIGPDSALEEYVCPRGLNGTYRLLLNVANGQVTGNRVELEITTLGGTDQARTVSKFLPLTDGRASYSFKLEGGRRERLREVDATLSLLPVRPASTLAGRKGPGSARRQQSATQAAAEFMTSRQIPFVTGTNVVNSGGVVAYQPVIQIIPEGRQLFAQAQVSADRRYVRLAVMPVFSTITNVFTFTFVGGAGTAQQPAR